MPSMFNRPQALLRPFITFDPARSVPKFRGLLGRQRDADLDALTKRIILPSLPVADEDMNRMSLWEDGRKLARQEEWDELSEQIRLGDVARLRTPGGLNETTLLAMGAHADVVAAALDALREGTIPDPSGLAALETILEDDPEDYTRAMIVALGHIRIARACKDATDAPHSGALALAGRARELLAPFDAEALDAPSLAMAQCAVAELLDEGEDTVMAAYRDAIRLDPGDGQLIRTYGQVLAEDRWAREAQEIAERVEETWGQGGYVWMLIDRLRETPEALAEVDAKRFVRGLRDILGTRPDQHICNELAAFCTLDMADETQKLSGAAQRVRQVLHAEAIWVLSQHIVELHPRLWAGPEPEPMEAPSQPSYRARAIRGRKRALRAIAKLFEDKLSDGSSIAFSPAGMYRLPAI